MMSSVAIITFISISFHQIVSTCEGISTCSILQAFLQFDSQYACVITNIFNEEIG